MIFLVAIVQTMKIIEMTLVVRDWESKPTKRDLWERCVCGFSFYRQTNWISAERERDVCEDKQREFRIFDR